MICFMDKIAKRVGSVFLVGARAYKQAALPLFS
jgi:hypothetical protein